MKVHHIGIACEDIHAAIEDLKSVYDITNISEIIYDPIQDATVCLITSKNSVSIELVSGFAVRNFLARGIKIYHVCYETENILRTIEELTKQNATVIANPAPAKLFNDRLVCFLQTPLGLIELLETTECNQENKFSTDLKLIIAANFTTEPVESTLTKLLNELNIAHQIIHAPYNQLYQQLVDDHSIFSSSDSSVNILIINFYEFLHYQIKDEEPINELHRAHLLKYMYELTEYTNQRAQKSKNLFLICFCKPNPNLSNENKQFIHQLEQQFIFKLTPHKNLQMITSDEVDANYKVKDYFDAFKNKLAHIPYKSEYFSAMAISIVRKLYSTTLRSQLYKVIVVDCDNTLWDGACAELGCNDVIIDIYRKNLQQFLITQVNNGMLLCLCSKNIESDILNVFNNHPNMVLKLEDITLSCINWQEKSENLQWLAKKLNLALNSFIFLDDDPVECLNMETHCPEVLTIQLPHDKEEMLPYINNLWAFDQHKMSEEAHNRTTLYKQNFAREIVKETQRTLEGFIENLELKININKLDFGQIVRATELIQRTNQFVIALNKKTDTSLLACINDNDHSYYIHVSDRFGDYGIVGLLILKVMENGIFLDTFLLSCRVLTRGVEYKILEKIKLIGKEQNKNRLVIPFVKTDKNEPAYKFIESLSYINKIPVDNYIEYEFNLNHFEANLNKTPYKNEAVNADTVRDPFILPANKYDENQKLINIASFITKLTTHKTSKIIRKFDINSMTAEQIEFHLLAIWGNVLNINLIHSNDNFFMLGGDSIHAVHIAAKIKNELHIDLTISDIFKNLTVYDLSRYLLSKKAESDSGVLLSWHHYLEYTRVYQKKYLLSYAQESLWFYEKAYPQSYIYNMPMEFIINGPLEVPALEHAFQVLIKKHDALRTGFIEENGVVYQIVHDSLSIQITVEDATNSTKKYLDEIIMQEEQTKFDLKCPPLIRIRLLKLADNKYLLLLTIHHIVFDGWSYGIIFADINKLYSHYQKPSHLTDEFETKYIDYAAWERELVNSDILYKQIDYWKNQLSDFNLRELPADFSTIVHEPQHGEYIPIVFDKNLAKNLKQLSLKYNISTYTILVSLFDLLIYRYTHYQDVSIGAIISTRRFNELKNVVGFFVNALALRIKLSEHESFEALLLKNKKTILEAFQNQDVPFGNVIQAVAPHATNNPFFQAIFLYQNALDYSLKLEGVQINKYRQGYNVARADLILELLEENNHIYGGFYYNKNYFKSSSIQEFIQCFQSFSDLFLSNPALLVRDVLCAQI